MIQNSSNNNPSLAQEIKAATEEIKLQTKAFTYESQERMRIIGQHLELTQHASHVLDHSLGQAVMKATRHINRTLKTLASLS